MIMEIKLCNYSSGWLEGRENLRWVYQLGMRIEKSNLEEITSLETRLQRETLTI